MDREQAWDAIHARLPAGWRVGPASYDPAARRYEVVATTRGDHRAPPPEYVIGVGLDELEALWDLAERLRVAAILAQ